MVGYKLLHIHHSTTYDGIFTYSLRCDHPKAIYDKEKNPLGLSPAAFSQRECIEYPPRPYEYKVNLDNLIEEFNSKDSRKQFENVDLVIVWELGKKWSKYYEILDLTEKGDRARTELFGITHILSRRGVEEGHFIYLIALREVVNILHGDKFVNNS